MRKTLSAIWALLFAGSLLALPARALELRKVNAFEGPPVVGFDVLADGDWPATRPVYYLVAVTPFGEFIHGGVSGPGGASQLLESGNALNRMLHDGWADPPTRMYVYHEATPERAAYLQPVLLVADETRAEAYKFRSNAWPVDAAGAYIFSSW